MALAGSRAFSGPSSSSTGQMRGSSVSSSVRKAASRGQTVRVCARRGRGDRRKPPPPDLPSLLFDQRIVYLGMPVSNPRGAMRPW